MLPQSIVDALNNFKTALMNKINNKANTADVYSKQVVDTKFALYDTISSVDNKVKPLILSDFSATQQTFSLGQKEFSISQGKGFLAGQSVVCISGNNYLYGQITSYDIDKLNVNVLKLNGTGTASNWTIQVTLTDLSTSGTGSGDLFNIQNGVI